MFKQPKTPKKPPIPAAPPTMAQEGGGDTLSQPFIAPIGYLTSGQGLTRRAGGAKKTITGV